MTSPARPDPRPDETHHASAADHGCWHPITDEGAYQYEFAHRFADGAHHIADPTLRRRAHRHAEKQSNNPAGPITRDTGRPAHDATSPRAVNDAPTPMPRNAAVPLGAFSAPTDRPQHPRTTCPPSSGRPGNRLKTATAAFTSINTLATRQTANVGSTHSHTTEDHGRNTEAQPILRLQRRSPRTVVCRRVRSRNSHRGGIPRYRQRRSLAATSHHDVPEFVHDHRHE